jgi:hypothetical protein
LWELGAKLHPSDEPAKRRWVMAHQHLLDDGQIEQLVAKLRALPGDDPKLTESIQKEANYFEGHAARMRYPANTRSRWPPRPSVSGLEAPAKPAPNWRIKANGR